MSGSKTLGPAAYTAKAYARIENMNSPYQSSTNPEDLHDFTVVRP